MGGLLRLGGGARLRDACAVSSRNIDLLSGESFLRRALNVNRAVSVCGLRFNGSRHRGRHTGAPCTFAPAVDP